MTLRRRLVDGLARTVGLAGLPTLMRRRRHRRRDFRVYILEYHDFCRHDAEEHEGVVSAARLRRHLRHLKRNFRLVTVAQAAEALASGLDEDLLVITCDDGYATNLELAWPVLRDEGVAATIYVTSGFVDGQPLWFDWGRRALAVLRQGPERLSAVGRETLTRVLGPELAARLDPGATVRFLKSVPGADRRAVLDALADLDLDLTPGPTPLTWAQVRELGEAGLEIGAHTVTHPILSRLPATEQETEIAGSRNRIEEATGIRPTTFAFPNGSAEDFGPETVEILRRQGFVANCTTIRGSNPSGCDPLTLKRLGIGSDSNALLTARLSGLFDEGLRRLLPRSLSDSPVASPGVAG